MAIRKVLRTYRFIDKDPVIDEVRTIVQDEGLYQRLRNVAELAGLAPATIDNMFHGETRRPQNATVMAIVTSLGYARKFVRDQKLNLEEELSVARAWNRKEKKRLDGLRNKKKRREP